MYWASFIAFCRAMIQSVYHVNSSNKRTFHLCTNVTFGLTKIPGSFPNVLCPVNPAGCFRTHECYTLKTAQQKIKKNFKKPPKTYTAADEEHTRNHFSWGRIPGCTDTYWTLTLVFASVKVSSAKSEDIPVPSSC